MFSKNITNIHTAAIVFVLILSYGCSSGKGFGVGNMSKEERQSLKEYNNRKADEASGEKTNAPETKTKKDKSFLSGFFKSKPDGPPGNNAGFKKSMSIQNKEVKKRMKRNARKAKRQKW